MLGRHHAAPVLPAVLARRTLIFGSSASIRVDSAPARFSSRFFARAPPQKVSCAARRHLVSPAQRRKILSSAQEAHFACEKCALAIHLEGRSLKLAGSNAAVGTALITCCVRATCERLQRRDGGGGTRVGRCGEGDSGSTMEKIVPPPRDEMTASSRRRRWCHRREAAPTALQMELVSRVR